MAPSTSVLTGTRWVIHKPTYRVRPHQLAFDGVFWRNLKRARLYYHEDVYETEADALQDAIHRVRARMDMLSDILIGLQRRYASCQK